MDGTPSPLKSKARIARFFRMSGIDLSSLPVAEEGVSVERNGLFKKCVQDCVVSLFILFCLVVPRVVGVLTFFMSISVYHVAFGVLFSILCHFFPGERTYIVISLMLFLIYK